MELFVFPLFAVNLLEKLTHDAKRHEDVFSICWLQYG